MAAIFLILAVCAISAAAPLIRWADPAPALTVAALRIGLAAVVLLAAARGEMRAIVALPRRDRWLVVLSGVLLGIHFGVWITSLYFTSTAASVALVATQPIFAALLAGRIGDRVGKREMIGIAVAAGGCAVLAGGDWALGPHALLGDALAVLGAVTAAGYLVVGRSLRVAVPLTPYLAAVNTVAAICLAVAALIAGAQVTGFDGHVYLAIGLSAVIPSLLGHTLLNLSVRRAPAHLVSLAILGEPVGAATLTWLLFAEVPPVHAALGGAVILAGIAVGFIGRGRR